MKRKNQSNIISEFRVTEVELVYRNKRKPEDRYQVTDSECAFRILRDAWDLNKIDLVEQFNILLLDRSLYCLGVSNISTGGISGCLVDPKIVFATALKARASSMILAHNHPSGNLSPSASDIALTKKLTEGGKLLDIAIPDHLIMTSSGYTSMSQHLMM